MERHGRDIILDRSRVTAIDAAGISALVSLQAAGAHLQVWIPVFEISESECREETMGLEAQIGLDLMRRPESA